MLLLGTRVDLGAMAMMRYTAFPKAPALFSVIFMTLVGGGGGVLLLYRNAVDGFYSHSRLGYIFFIESRYNNTS